MAGVEAGEFTASGSCELGHPPDIRPCPDRNRRRHVNKAAPQLWSAALFLWTESVLRTGVILLRLTPLSRRRLIAGPLVNEIGHFVNHSW